MSNTKEYALIEIKFSLDSLPDFSNQISSWVKGHSGVTPFDFDNHSETYTVELVLKLVAETDRTFLFVGCTDQIDQLGGTSKFLNRITRKYKDKMTVVYLCEESRLLPFFKVLNAEKCEGISDAKGRFDAWVKGLETDPHLPGKETDL